MTGGERRATKRRRSLVAWSLPIGGAVVLFVLGMGLGQALEENRDGGETRTSIRTLEPETLPAQTVTVTVSAP